MIELQRARLLAAGKGSKTGQSAHYPNGSPPGAAPSHSTHSYLPITPQPQQTPHEAATAAMHTEDRQMDRFIQRLHLQRDDSRPGDASTGPTVPTALSRRMLQRQGIGFLDSTVAAVASAAADRFLATVLQQAVACRDQRLKGADLDRVAAMQRQRHKRQYREDADDRRRRKQEQEDKRTKYNLAVIAAADALKQKNTDAAAKSAALAAASDKDGDADASKAKKRKKTTADTSTMVNGRRRGIDSLSDDELSYDSVDEEEKYYRRYYNDTGDDENEIQSDNEVDDDETMILRDLARPLEAWDFDVSGKEGMYRLIDNQEAADDEPSDDDDSESVDEMEVESLSGAGGDSNSHDAATENGTATVADDDPRSKGVASKKAKANSPDGGGTKSSPTSRKSSPVPPGATGSRSAPN